MSTVGGKIATGIAGMTGTGSLGVAADALIEIASAHAVPVGIWVVLAWLSAATVMVAGLGLFLDYKRTKLEIEAQTDSARSRVDLERARLGVYRGLVEKSADAAGNMASYRDLILADALHLAVERNDVRPADRTHGQLFRASSEVAATSVLPDITQDFYR